MHLIFLEFSENKSAAAQYMSVHDAWIEKGLADGVFQLVGSVLPAAGGVILAAEKSRDALESRLDADPFVRHDVVRARIVEIRVNKTSAPLNHLKE